MRWVFDGNVVTAMTYCQSKSLQLRRLAGLFLKKLDLILVDVDCHASALSNHGAIGRTYI